MAFTMYEPTDQAQEGTLLSPFNRSTGNSSSQLAGSNRQQPSALASGLGQHPFNTLNGVRPPLAWSSVQQPPAPVSGSPKSEEPLPRIFDDGAALLDPGYSETTLVPKRLRGTQTHTTSDRVPRATVLTGPTAAILPTATPFQNTTEVLPTNHLALMTTTINDRPTTDQTVLTSLLQSTTSLTSGEFLPRPETRCNSGQSPLEWRLHHLLLRR